MNSDLRVINHDHCYISNKSMGPIVILSYSIIQPTNQPPVLKSRDLSEQEMCSATGHVTTCRPITVRGVISVKLEHKA